MKHAFFNKVILTLFICCVTIKLSFSQSDYKEIFEIDIANFYGNHIALAESTRRNKTKLIQIPIPEKGKVDFVIQPNKLLSKDFSANFPDIKTFTIQSVGNQNISGRLTYSPKGLYGTIFSEGNTLNLKPVQDANSNLHQIESGASNKYHRSDTESLCKTDELKHLEKKPPSHSNSRNNQNANGTILRTFRIAIATTGEYGTYHGGNSTEVATQIANVINGLEAIFERDLAVNFELLNPIIFLDKETDPFTPSKKGGAARTLQARTVIEDYYVRSSFDIGHVFNLSFPLDLDWEGGGVAYIGSLCSENKARGWSAQNRLASNSDFLGTVAHEIGHQFGGRHTFNGTEASCSNPESDYAYEIGSGTTIMSYLGLCGPENIQRSGHLDFYFHTNSLEIMLAYLSTVTCGVSTTTNNNPPLVLANPENVTNTIPQGTPFELKGQSEDSNGDNLTYCWEQYDEDGPGTPTKGYIGASAGTSATAPLFRSYPPNNSPNRIFPDLHFILKNEPYLFEPLPTVNRNLNFRLIVRDNQTGGGGIAWDERSINVDASAGPFFISTQNQPTDWIANGTNSVAINWNVAGTNAGTVNCAKVDILFSADGGYSFPYTLLEETSNNGTATVLIPSINTRLGRIKIKCSDNIFFDINDADINILTTCFANASTISPSSTICAFPGDAEANLTLAPTYQINLDKLEGSIGPNDLVGYLVGQLTSGECQVFNGNDPQYDKYEVIPTVTGNYSFTGLKEFEIINVYEKELTGFRELNCENWLAGNFTNGIVRWKDNLTTSLTVGKKYIIVISGFYDGDFGDYSINVDGPVNGYLQTHPVNPGAGYTYTYLAVNSNNKIVGIEDDSDFTDNMKYGVGEYKVYGFSVETGVNLSGYINQSFSEIKNALIEGNICGDLSDNFVTLQLKGCIEIGEISGESAICTGDNSTTLTVTGLEDMGTLYGIQLVYFASPRTGTNMYSAPTGLLGILNNNQLQNNYSTVVMENINFPTPPGTYYIYALPSPVPSDVNCRPFAEFQLEVKPYPSFWTPLINPCSEETTNEGTFTNVVPANTTFSWSHTNDNLGLPTSGTGNIPSFVANTNEPIFETTTVNIVADGEGCIVDSRFLSIDVTKAPTITLGAINHPNSVQGTEGSITIEGFPIVRSFIVSYRKDGGAPIALAIRPKDGKYTIENLSAGVYTDINIVLNGNDCVSNSVNITLEEPDCPIPGQIFADFANNHKRPLYVSWLGNYLNNRISIKEADTGLEIYTSYHLDAPHPIHNSIEIGPILESCKNYEIWVAGQCEDGSFTSPAIYQFPGKKIEIYEPDGGESLIAGEDVNVEWVPYANYPNCNTVTISLTTNDTDYNYILAENVENDGDYVVTLPSGLKYSANCRIKVDCFSDCADESTASDQTFTINSACKDYPFDFEGSGNVIANCQASALDLDLDLKKGIALSSYNMNTTATNLYFSNYIYSLFGNCRSGNGLPRYYEVLEFYVPTEGDYNISLANSSNQKAALQLYESTFYPDDLCKNWIKSTNGRTLYLTHLTANLKPHTKYIAVFFVDDYSDLNKGSATVNFTPSVLSGGPLDVPVDYTYTFLATNSMSNIIHGISTSADFRKLPEGVHRIQALTVRNSDLEAVNELIGQPISKLDNGNICYSISKKEISVEVNQPCITATTTVNEVVCGMGPVYINFQIFGGTAPYKVSFTDGVSTYSIEDYQSSAPFEVFPQSNISYTILSVEDANGNQSILNTGISKVNYIKPEVIPPNTIITTSGTLNEAINFSATTTANFYWENDNPSIGIPLNGVDNIMSFTPLNTSSEIVEAAIQVTPSINGCNGTPQRFTIKVLPETNDCQNDLFLSEELISDKVYTASNLVYCNSRIKENKKVALAAGNSIILQPGFHATKNSKFEAIIFACSNEDEILPRIPSKLVIDSKPYSKSQLTKGFEVYPNPANNKLTIITEHIKEEIIALSIFNSNGKIVKNIISKFSQSEEEILKEIHISDLNRGIYFIRLSTKSSILTKKLLVIR